MTRELVTKIKEGTHSLTYSLTHLTTYSLTHSPTHSLTHSLTHSQGVYYSKRKSESDKYAIKRYHQLLKENTGTHSLTHLLTHSPNHLLTHSEKPKLLDTINKDNLARCVPAELLIRTTGTASRKVARIAAPGIIYYILIYLIIIINSFIYELI
jgi:hypothetical protein